MNFELLDKKRLYFNQKETLLSANDDNYGDKRAMLDIEFLVNYNYESTAIEGNTLSRIQHNGILQKNECPATEHMTTIFEAVNHADAFQLIKNMSMPPFTEEMVSKVHRKLMEHLLAGGAYRTCNVMIKSATHVFPSFDEVPALMQKFFIDYNKKAEELHPIELAAWVHEEFVSIHPFQDGNGRMARLLMNYVLMHNEYLPISIPLEVKAPYFRLLDEYYAKRDITALATLISDLEEKRLNHAIGVIEPLAYPLIINYEYLRDQYPDEDDYLEELKKIMDQYKEEVAKKRGF